MSAKTNSYAGIGFSKARGTDSNNTTKTLVVEGKPGVQAFLRDVKATGGSAGALVHGFAARYGKKTTVKTATAAAATSIVLNADVTTGYINGYQIQDNDYLLVATNAGSALDTTNTGFGWRLVLISACSEATLAATCTVSGLDGITGIEGICSVGAVAYVIPAASRVTLPLAAAAVVYEDVLVGEVGAPIGVMIVPGGATAHFFSIAGDYQ